MTKLKYKFRSQFIGNKRVEKFLQLLVTKTRKFTQKNELARISFHSSLRVGACILPHEAE